jgi:hypothetical protein
VRRGDRYGIARIEVQTRRRTKMSDAWCFAFAMLIGGSDLAEDQGA